MKEKLVDNLLWAASIFVVLVGAMLMSNGVYGFCLVLSGLSLNPKVRSALSLKVPYSLIIAAAFFALAVYLTPASRDGAQGEGATETQTEVQTEIAEANSDAQPESIPEATDYLTEITWAALESYKCAVERDDYDGDVIASGTYFAEPVFVDFLSGKDIPIIWDIYVSTNNYNRIEELDSSELVASVGGWNKNTGEFTVVPGQYVYVKYTGTLGNPSGALSLTRISASEEPDDKVDIEPLHLNAGDWIVGVDIEAGRYTITTEDSLCILKVQTEDEEFPHINAYLEEGDGGYTGTLEDGDQLHCSEPIDLTPYRP